MANILFYLSAGLTVFGAVMVASTRNVMHACFYLLASLIGVAGLYLTLGADFVAATQLVVYVGGVVILMVFAVMLTGGPHSQESNKFGMIKTAIMGDLKTYIVGIVSALVFLFIICDLVLRAFNLQIQDTKGFLPTVDRIGYLLVTDHVLAFEISSVLLLGSLVGAAIIARPSKKNKG